jgi:hypothetical protein
VSGNLFGMSTNVPPHGNATIILYSKPELQLVVLLFASRWSAPVSGNLASTNLQRWHSYRLIAVKP